MVLRQLKNSMEKTKTYIYGASGHGKVILDILLANDIIVDGFIDDDPAKKTFSGLPVFRTPQIDQNEDKIILGIGNNIIRKKLAEKLNGNVISAIHPAALVSPNASIDEGTVVMQMAVIQTGTHIGKHCIINTKASVDHDCHVGDYVHVSPGATICGGVTIGDLSWIGAGATVIQNIRIGSNATIGAGSVILRDVPDNVTVFGNPGRMFKPHLKGAVD